MSQTDQQKYSYSVTAELAGVRLDKVVSQLSGLSRTRISQLVELKCIKINGKEEKSSLICKAGDFIEIEIPQILPTEIKPFHLDLEIIYEDDDVLVVNKPAGLVTHPSAGHEEDTLVNVLITQGIKLSMGFAENRPGIVHRLDKETSGLLVIAKNDPSHHHLSQQFQERTMKRKYEALVFLKPPVAQGTVMSYLARHPIERKKIASVRDKNKKIIRTRSLPETPSHKWSITHYQVLHTRSDLSLLELRLETGRTHQIRVHLSELGHPLVGDSTYGADRKIPQIKNKELREEIKNYNRFLLHAKTLGFQHPKTRDWLEFQVDWPEADKNFLTRWRFFE